MPRHIENTLDKAQYAVGGTVFTLVAAVTAVVMAIGFPVLEAIDWLRRRA